MTQRWAYLGPEGTFTEQAAHDLAARVQPTPDLIPASTVTQALAQVRQGQADAAVVALESSVEGAVPLTQDELIHGAPVQIAAEAYVRVTFSLLARPGVGLDQVKRVGSHPHGLAQVREWLAAHLPNAELVPAASNAAAAAQVAEGGLDAAAAGPAAGERFDLVPLATDIGLDHDAVTRFVLLTRPGLPPEPTGNDRSSFILGIDNQPGSLLAVLAEIAGRGINMTRLESRPKRGHPGDYVFLVDADGHLAEPAMSDMVAALLRRDALLRWLGSYPRAVGSNVTRPDFALSTSYDRARTQVATLLRGDR